MKSIYLCWSEWRYGWSIKREAHIDMQSAIHSRVDSIMWRVYNSGAWRDVYREMTRDWWPE